MRVSAAANAAILASFLVFSGFRPLLGEKQKHPYVQLTNAEALTMLDLIEKDIQKDYYDPSLRGIDLKKKFAEERLKIAASPSPDAALLHIAAAVEALNDSHTRFIPPIRPYSVDYGFWMQPVGDSACYVTAVRPGSDAEAKGLKKGDEIVAINGITLVRQDIGTIEYGYSIAPQPGFHLTVRTPEGKVQQLTVMAKVIPGQKDVTTSDFSAWIDTIHSIKDYDQFYGFDNHSQFFSIEHKVLFWKFPSFMVDPEYLDQQINKARNFDYIVLDLRGNPGGRMDVVDSLTGSFFEHDVKMMDRQTRKKLKPEIAKGKGDRAIQGKLIVLIDGQSASGAELFARVIQLQKRGVVLGDRSSGQVMESERLVHAVSLDPWNVSQYWTSVTIANLIMGDGKSLEGVGVTPDERILPTAEDLAAGRDPVLARAAALAGVQMSPEKAGKIFTFKWPEPPHAME